MKAIVSEVVVVGGGAIGLSCAWHLAQKGVKVVLVDAGAPAGGTSGACGGYLCVSTKLPGTMMRMAQLSQSIYPGFAKALGQGLELERIEGLLLIERLEDRSAAEAHTEAIRACGVPARTINGVKMRELEPAISKEMVGGILCPNELGVTPYDLVFALVRALEQLAVPMYWNHKVESIDAGARASSLEAVNRHGERIGFSAEQFVIATGVWSGEVGRKFGLTLPVIPRRGELLVSARNEAIVSRPVVSARYLAAKAAGVEHKEDDLSRFGYAFGMETTSFGQNVVGTTRTFGGFNRAPDPGALRIIMSEGAKRIPALNGMTLIRAYAGLRPYVPDRKPIIGRSSRIPNVVVATGHEGDGMTLTPLTGKLVTDIVLQRSTVVPLDEFSPDRFESVAVPGSVVAGEDKC